MRPTFDIMIPISGIEEETDEGIQVMVRATNKLAWLPKRHLDYLPGAVVVPVWLARKIREGKDESIHRREVETGAVSKGDQARPQ